MGTNLMRDLATEIGNCFLVTPYGVKPVADRLFDFDSFHRNVTAPTVTSCGLTVHRADSIYGPAGVLDTVWRGIQKAEVVIVDFTGRSENVAIEFAWAMLLGKRIIVLAQDASDIPSDVRGLYRYIKYSEHFDAVERMRAELTQQLTAIRNEPVAEKMLTRMWDDPVAVPARTTVLDPAFVAIRPDDGRRGILGNIKKGTKYVMLAGKANPWLKLAADCPPVTRPTAEVTSVVGGVGLSVQVGNGINGRIRGSDLVVRLGRGQKVEITVNRIDPERRRVDVGQAGRHRTCPARLA